MTLTTFFSNTKLCVIYMAIGYVFLFVGGFWARQVQLEWMSMVATASFLLLALYYIMKDYNKEYDQIKRL